MYATSEYDTAKHYTHHLLVYLKLPKHYFVHSFWFVTTKYCYLQLNYFQYHTHYLSSHPGLHVLGCGAIWSDILKNLNHEQRWQCAQHLWSIVCISNRIGINKKKNSHLSWPERQPPECDFIFLSFAVYVIVGGHSSSSPSDLSTGSVWMAYMSHFLVTCHIH